MNDLTEDLFLSVSELVHIRLTPENLRVQMAAIDSSGGITPKIKTGMLIELLLAFAKLEKKIDATGNTQTQKTP